MSRSRKPRPIHTPDPAPMARKITWRLIWGGVAAILVGAALGVTISTGFLPIGLLGGLAFALGVSGLAERKQIALPAFLVGLAAPFLLTFVGHSVLMQQIGHVERCGVVQAKEFRSAKYPSVDYTLECRSGMVELSRDYRDRLDVTKGADVLIGPPLRPVFAEPSSSGWSPWLLVMVPLSMVGLVPLARALRQQA